MTVAPTGVEPVKPILRMPGWSAISCPISRPANGLLWQAVKVKGEEGDGTAAGEDVDDAGGDAGLGGELGELEGREGRDLGRLVKDGVPRRQTGRHLPGQHHQRVVPRRHLTIPSPRGLPLGKGGGRSEGKGTRAQTPMGSFLVMVRFRLGRAWLMGMVEPWS